MRTLVCPLLLECLFSISISPTFSLSICFKRAKGSALHTYPYLRVRNECSVGALAQAVVGHDGALLGEALHVLGLLRQEALRDQQRKVRVVHVVRLDALQEEESRGEMRRQERDEGRWEMLAQRTAAVVGVGQGLRSKLSPTTMRI